MVFITAEIGTNHMGDVKIVKKIIDLAHKVGCDAVKFQKKKCRENLYKRIFGFSS